MPRNLAKNKSYIQKAFLFEQYLGAPLVWEALMRGFDYVVGKSSSHIIMRLLVFWPHLVLWWTHLGWELP